MPDLSTAFEAPHAGTRLGKPRAALVVYRQDKGHTRFLLVSAASNPSKLTLPGGKVDCNESPKQAALRETAEEAGVVTHAPRALGRYLHTKQGGRVYPTDVFVARFAGTLAESEGRAVRWVTIDDLRSGDIPLRRVLRRQLLAADTLLAQQRLAA